ncbi:MAG: Wzz/FepE/Etk N-terminal domain-containing protein, partial [Burkholderiales bacterium]
MRNQPERLSSNEDVDLFQLIGWLWAQKILIAAVTVIVALAALAYALLSTPIYQATVAVQP